jgi:hypothetical protein
MKPQGNNRRTVGILWLILLGVAPILPLATTRTVFAQSLIPGDIVIATQTGPTANNDFGVALVDPANRNRTILSDNTTGTGPDFSKPEGVAIEPHGSLLAINDSQNALLRVDPATGNRTILSGLELQTERGLGLAIRTES